MKERKINVIGWDDGFSGQAEQLLSRAQLVIGAPRLLELPQIPAARSDRISPNRFGASSTRNSHGFLTSHMAAASTLIFSVAIP